jgi:hypothetical protein
MMERLTTRAGELARVAQERRVRNVAQKLRTLFGNAAIEVEEARVLVRGRGIIKRWLIDRSLRFLGGGLK